MDDAGGSREQPYPKILITCTEIPGGGDNRREEEQREAGTTPAETSEEEEEEADAGGSDSEETLDIAGYSSVRLCDSPGQADFLDNSSSLLLSEVPIQYSFHPPGLLKEIKEASTVHSKLELSPTSVTQSILSDPSPTLGEQRLLCPRENMTDTCMQDVEDNQKSSCPKLFCSVPVLKVPPPDGYMYNWRKYGQKQVKSPHQGSRSYYRCTYSDCHAKKIEYSDHMHRVTETVYRSTHNHEPPQKVNIPKETKHALSPSLHSHDSKIAHLNSSSDAAMLSSTGKKDVHEPKPISPFREHEPSRLNDNPATYVKGEDCDEHAQNKRLKKKNPPKCSEFLPNPDKKAKMVVHVSRDVGISSDGYKWRKYGQKMVKGNPHPRNYYRCTSAGCPVRKHMERAVGNSSVVIVTYTNVHDHEMPIPKERYDPPTATSLVPTTTTTTQWPPVDEDGTLTGEELEQEGEPNAPSAKSLLSVGFEIKPC